MPWRTLSMDLDRKKGEVLHVRELAKQRVRLPDRVQEFLLLRQATLSIQARVAIMTLPVQQLVV